jgi:hypothetical protein
MCLSSSGGITGLDLASESYEDDFRTLATPRNGFLDGVELRFVIELDSASG